MELLGYLLILVFTVLNLGESMVVKAYAKRFGSGGKTALADDGQNDSGMTGIHGEPPLHSTAFIVDE